MKHLWKSSSEYSDEMVCTQCNKSVTGYCWAVDRADLVFEECVGQEAKIEDPSYYNQLKPEPINVTEGWELNVNLASVIWYIARAGKKTADPKGDLLKARRFLSREIARLEGRRAWD